MQSPANKNSQSHLFRNLLKFCFSAALLVAIGYGAYHWQPIVDEVKLRTYNPPAAISQLVEQDTMTPYGQRIFYLNRPSIQGKDPFSHNCPNNGGEQTIVLGCYHDGEHGIYLLSVTDPRLDGVQQVTAAHEMLHGAYERLSDGDRSRVDAMLLDYYNNGLQDQRIRDTIAGYTKSEPGQEINEMHSIFGTEISSLPAGLEQYYTRYFTNRSRIAGFAAQYQSEFTKRQAAITAYDAQLSSLKSQITTGKADLQIKQDAIDTEQDRLTKLKNSGDAQGYNAGVPTFNAMVNAYNAEIENIKAMINQYNVLVDKRNAIALEEEQLNKDLSTDTSTISQ